MMRISSIESVSPSDIEWSDYDVAFFASGFEARSTHATSLFPQEALACAHVFGFPDGKEILSRASNDIFFENLLGRKPYTSESLVDVEREFCRILNHTGTGTGRSKIRVFVDFSVMTRDWYGYILTWAKYQDVCTDVTIDFAYSHGDYLTAFDPLQINEIVCVPGFEGGGAGARKTTAFFGLGFDGAATLTVYDLIEPDEVVCFIAKGGVSDIHADTVLRQNSEIVDISRSDTLELPLSDVRRSVALLLERASVVSDDSDEVLFVPMGPKTHVLACLIACQLNPKIACMHAKGKRDTPVQIRASGPVSISRVIYSKFERNRY